MTNENKYPSGGSGTGLQTVVIRKGMAACTDRIGGAGVVTHGVVGVATQSDALLDAEGVKLYWYRQGKDDGVEHERAKIVAWLRDGFVRDWGQFVAQPTYQRHRSRGTFEMTIRQFLYENFGWDIYEWKEDDIRF